jgi:hypothetical protein
MASPGIMESLGKQFVDALWGGHYSNGRNLEELRPESVQRLALTEYFTVVRIGESHVEKACGVVTHVVHLGARLRSGRQRG